LASLTLGLAPFNEPHIWGKLKWVAGGAVGMKLIDWVDLLMHGTPWVFLFWSLALAFRDGKSNMSKKLKLAIIIGALLLTIMCVYISLG
jgi:hypothetical protein